MGYRISRPYNGGKKTLYLMEHGMLSSNSTEIPERATLFKYDDMVQIVAAEKVWAWTAEFVPETEGEREFDTGTLWVTPSGVSYRLRDYSPDFKAEDPWAQEVPSYNSTTPGGANHTVYRLPADARLVWHPEGK